MSLIIAGVVIYGFSYTVDDNLIHPAIPRPWLLYVHAFVFSAWLPLFIAQAALIQTRNVATHRRLGQWGLVHGAAIPILGVATAIVMTKFRLAHGEPDAADSLPIPLFDMIAFTSAFSLAAIWRHRKEFHRRLMFMATCTLTAAAFGRMPALDHADWFYLGVDALILIGALWDLFVTGTVHAVYRYGLPAMILGQSLAAYIRWSPEWIAFAHRLFQ